MGEKYCTHKHTRSQLVIERDDSGHPEDAVLVTSCEDCGERWEERNEHTETILEMLRP